MIKLLALLLSLSLLTTASESPLSGKITFTGTKDTATIRPLSEQPKIANIKNSMLEFLIIPELQSCGPLDKVHFQRQVGEPPVLAVIDFTSNQRLTCGMSLKIRRIKEAGGAGFIIVTNDPQFSINHCAMYDDNSFFTGVMDQANFNILKAQKVQPIYGVLTIQLKDSDKDLLEIWTSSLNADSYASLALLQSVFARLPSLKERVEWRPRIASLGCAHGQNPNICSQEGNVASCGCKGEFCSPQAHERTSSVLVHQDIRQSLIFKQYASKYFSYVSKFKDQCLSNYQSSKYSSDCATNVMDKLEIDSYSINSAIEDFLDRCAVDQEQDVIRKTEMYATLQKDKNAFANYGRYPLLLLNKKILQYKNQDDLSGQLCRKMSLQDDGCFQISSIRKTTTVGILFYILLVLLLLTIGAAVVYFYRKKLKRDMNKQIKMQVSTAVEHYFALTEVK